MTAPPRSTAPDLQCQRDAFTLPNGLHYLNCAYMAPLAREVEAAGIAGLQKKRAPHVIQPSDFFEDGHEVRARFAEIIGARDPKQVALVPSVSYGVAIAARNCTLHKGQSIVVAREQFPSNVYVWRRIAQEVGADLRVVGHGEPDVEHSITNALLDAIDDTTSVIAIGTVAWTDGEIRDLGAIGARAREVGAAYILDGTQSIGALPFDLQAAQPDALVVGGYKWLLGPYGIAVAYFGERFADGTPIEEPWIVREGSEEFRALVDYRDEYRPGALRFDAGGMSNFITVPMVRTALDLLLRWGVSAVQAYCEAIIAPLREVAERRGWGMTNGASHLVGIRLPDHSDLEALRRRLDEAQVSVSLRGAALRVSPHVYNDQDDIDALIEVLEETL